MTYRESWVERQIREATERGEFDNLSGTGKPLRIANSQDPDWWVKNFLDREGLDTSATLPPVMQLRAEHSTFPESLVEFAREEQVREILRDYNMRVVEDRLRPVLGRAMPAVAPRVDIDAMVERWRELRAALTEPDDQPEPDAALDDDRNSRRQGRRWWRRAPRPR